MLKIGNTGPPMASADILSGPPGSLWPCGSSSPSQEVAQGSQEEKRPTRAELQAESFHFHLSFSLTSWLVQLLIISISHSWVLFHPHFRQSVFSCNHTMITSRYPIHAPREACYGDMNGFPGIRNYGVVDPDDMYDVYCYAEELYGQFSG